LIHGHPNIFGNLAQKQRRNVTAAVDRNGRAAAIFVSELLVGSPLAYFFDPSSTVAGVFVASTEAMLLK
jgi:hypothetical protein